MSTLGKSNAFNLSFFDEQKAQKNFRRNIKYVVGYARLSFDEDGEGFCSILNQQSILENVYNEHFKSERSTYKFIADDNVTGYKFNRPGLFKVIELIENGQCNIIIAKDLSRIGRHSALTQLFIEQCERIGIQIMAMDDYDSRKESDDLILGIRAWSNERVVKDTSAKILKIVRHKQANGTWFCAAPYGYKVLDYSNGVVEVDPVAAEILNRIATMYLEGAGVNLIAKTLTFEGIPTPSQRAHELAAEEGRSMKGTPGNRWSGGQISKMLDDDFYIGVLRTGKYKRRGINGSDARTPVEDHHVFDNHHPPIFSLDVFQAIQRRRKLVRNSNYRGSRKGSTLYHGLLYCGDCGCKLYTYKNKTVQRQYVCSAHFKYGNSVCSRHTIKEATLTQMILAYLQMIHDTCADVLASINKEVADVQRETQRQKISIQTLQSNLEALNKKLETIETQRIKQIIAHPEREDSINSIYDNMITETQSDITRIKKEISFLESSIGVDVVNTSKARTALGVLDDVINSKTLTRRDVEALLDKVIVYENGSIEIKLNTDVGAMKIPSFEHVEKDYKQPEKHFEVSGINVVRDGDPPLTTFTSKLLFLEILQDLRMCFRT